MGVEAYLAANISALSTRLPRRREFLRTSPVRSSRKFATRKLGSDGISTPYFAAATMTFSMSGGLRRSADGYSFTATPNNKATVGGGQHGQRQGQRRAEGPPREGDRKGEHGERIQKKIDERKEARKEARFEERQQERKDKRQQRAGGGRSRS